VNSSLDEQTAAKFRAQSRFIACSLSLSQMELAAAAQQVQKGRRRSL